MTDGVEDSDDALRRQTLELAQRYQAFLGEGRLDEWISLWHDEAILEFPYAPAGRAGSYHGKEAILAYMTAASGRIATDGIDELRVHETADPRVLIVELASRGHLVGSGARRPALRLPLRAARRSLWRYREYWNPLVSMDGTVASTNGSTVSPRREIQLWRESPHSEGPGPAPSR